MNYSDFDNFLTNNAREKIKSAKQEKTAATKNNDFSYVTGQLIGSIFVAAVKFSIISLVAWWGWRSLESVSGLPHLEFLQVVYALAAVRCVSIFLIDPYVKTTKAEESK